MNVLLHICCGVCAGSVAERLLSEGNRVTGYFFNPNIHPDSEYERRLDVVRRVADWLDFPLEVAPYEPQSWLDATLPLASEPEGGKRCELCYRIRLQATFEHMNRLVLDAFTTTLTVSPHKSPAVVNNIGTGIGSEKFMAGDFKKKDGFKRANEIARQLELYRQDYCGCVYSMNNKTGR